MGPAQTKKFPENPLLPASQTKILGMPLNEKQINFVFAIESSHPMSLSEDG